MLRRAISLRTLLLGGLVLQLAATAAVISLVGYWGGQGSAHQLAQRSQRRASQQVRDFLINYLKTPQQVIRLMAEEVGSGRLDPADPNAVRRYLWGLHGAFPNAPYLNYGWADGDFIGLGQVDNTSRRPFLELAQAPTIQRLEQIRLDAAGEPAGLERIKPFADFRADGWYSKPLQAGRAVWTPIYNWVDAPEVMAMGAGIPVRRHGQLLGVAGVDVFLANICAFLQSLSIAESGEVYIVEPNGLLVADSSGRLPFMLVSGRAVRLQAAQASEPVIRDSARALMARFGAIGTLDQPRQLRIPIGRSRAMVRVEPYRDDQGLNWRIVVVLPEQDLYGELRDQALTHLGISLVAIVISGGLGLLVVEFVIRGLNQLVVHTDAMAEGDLSRSVPTESIVEMDRLAHSFNLLAERLRRSFSTLRSSNREIQRLLRQQSQALARSEEQLKREIRQRQRIEHSLGQDDAGAPARLLGDPQTGLLNLRGLQRQLDSSRRLGSTDPQPACLVLLSLAAPHAPGGSLQEDGSLAERIAAVLEVRAARHRGVAAQLGPDRYALLLRGMAGRAGRALVQELAVALQPLVIRAAAADLNAAAGSDAWTRLLPRAEQALEQALASADPPGGEAGLACWVLAPGPC